ncbi:MAG TPA: NAD(P)/FAD-dependent oxidoreductase [Mycobacteriales bacterium]|jgi:NADH dehydrogenase|nr:NAD(P)/FAD-dependent oxidoreductase [Mycobacteriales bacterium]
MTAGTPAGSSGRPHIVVVGGGYVGLYTALRLQNKLRRSEASITVIDPRSYMTYQPFLPEAGAGNLEPRHVVVPLRKVLRRCQVLAGYVSSVDHGRKVVRFVPHQGEACDVTYDILVMAVGSVVRTLPIPGLKDCAIGFKTVEEAIYLRNHVLARLDVAASTTDQELRRKALTFVFVGGGYAGVEALAELEDMAVYAMRYYDGLHPSDMRWVMVEATGRILPEVSWDMARYTVDRLSERRIEVLLNTRVKSVEGGRVVLDDGQEFDADTIVWTAGVRPNPLTERTDLPIDDRKRIRCTEFLTVEGVDDAWAAGDCAAVPDLTKGPDEYTSPSAQHAVRQAKQLAANIVASLRGGRLQPYQHAYAGSVASLGLHKGVAQVYGIKLRGWPAWVLHRTYHLARVPTFNRKSRIAADWTLALFFQREIVSLGAFANPRREFEEAASPSNGAPTGNGAAPKKKAPAKAR